MTHTKEKTKVDVGIAASGAEAISEQLNRYLSSLQILNTKLHNYHWNVEGENFFTLHEVLEGLYDAVFAEIDGVAERILKIGFRPLARNEDYLKHSSIRESESRGIVAKDIVVNLIADYQTLCKDLRSLIEIAGKHGDEGTADDAVGFLKDKEKQVWMLTAFNS